MGANGSGKTTLLKMLIKEYAGDSGSVTYGPGVKVGYYDQLMSGLSDKKTVMDEIWDAYPKMDQTGVRTALGSFLFSGEDVFKKIGSLSGGEKARVAILKLMLSGCNLLLLDEPTNHLDITSREALETAIESFDGTALIISHDRYLIKQTATRVYKLTPHGTEEVTDVIEETITSAEEQKLTAVKKEAVTDSANKADYLKRKELQSEIRKLNTRINRAEQRISELEDEIAKINEEMASPEASADYERIAELSEKLGQLQEELDAQTDEWAEASERLEEISE